MLWSCIAIWYQERSCWLFILAKPDSTIVQDIEKRNAASSIISWSHPVELCGFLLCWYLLLSRSDENAGYDYAHYAAILPAIVLYYYAIYTSASSEWSASLRRVLLFPPAELSAEVESLSPNNVSDHDSDHDRAATQPSKVKNITILVLEHG